eukprot:m.111533 g.111533  ORF g.111533 m.111533 type:complete len:665 (-) comp21372_c0_seq7:914-2908(-)
MVLQFVSSRLVGRLGSGNLQSPTRRLSLFNQETVQVVALGVYQVPEESPLMTMLVLFVATTAALFECVRTQRSIPVADEGTIACGSLITGNTSEGVHRTGFGTAPDHWWKFTAPVHGNYSFTSCGSSYDSVIRVFNRTGGNHTSQVTSCDDDCGTCGNNEMLTVELEVGSYFIVLDGYDSAQGLYRLRVTCPTVAIFQSAIACGGQVSGNTSISSVSRSTLRGAQHHYSFTAPYDGMFDFNSCGSAFATSLHVFQRSTARGGLLGEQASYCDDCGPCGMNAVLSLRLSAGNYIVVMGGFETAHGVYTLGATCTPAPAAPISAGTLQCRSAPTQGSTVDGSTSIGHAAPEVFYIFTAPQTGLYEVSTCDSALTTFDTFLFIFERNNQNNTRGRQIAACDDCGPCGAHAEVIVMLIGGVTYWIAVGGFAMAQGNFSLRVSCPRPTASPTVGAAPTAATPAPASAPPTPHPVVAVGNGYGGSVACSQRATGDTATGTNMSGNLALEHWWVLVAPVNGVYTMSTCGSSYDTYVYVYTRLGNGSVGEAVARCDDCGPCGLQSVLSTALTSGTFWIVMGGYLNHSGTYQLEIVCPTSALALGTLSCGGAGVQGNTTEGVSTIGHDAPEHYYSFVARWNGVRYCSRLNPDFSLVLLLTWIVLNMGSVGNSS